MKKGVIVATIGIDTELFCEALGKLNEQMEEVKRVWGAIQEIFEQLWKSLKPVMDEINNIVYGLDYKPKRKEIYRHKYYKVKLMDYKPNHKTRYFCIGNKGNYRRF
ncbi:hypothetical protein [Acetobacterium sp.]|uniref:hypothetical protein n=1 Tax=Acetobacterium sp. TaxID=1872094 RepID=UPI002F3EF670